MRSRMLLLGVLGSFVAGGFAVSASSQGSRTKSEAIRKRQDIFHSFGVAVKEPGAMLRNEAPFDLAVVQASLKTLADGAPKLKSLFPDDSKSEEHSEALPEVWTKKDHFLRVVDQLAATAAAASAAIKDEPTFRSEWSKVSSNCRVCHKAYRVLPKN